VRWVSRERAGPVALREVEPGRVGADDPPLHRVFGRQHVELAAQGGRVGGFEELRRAYGCADEDSGAIGQLAKGLRGGGGQSEAEGANREEWRIPVQKQTSGAKARPVLGALWRD